MRDSLIALIILWALLSPGCRLPSSELTPEEHDLVDTLYTDRVKLLRAELDSICEVQTDSMKRRAVDSLVELQLIEIKKLISRE